MLPSRIIPVLLCLVACSETPRSAEEDVPPAMDASPDASGPADSGQADSDLADFSDIPPYAGLTEGFHVPLEVPAPGETFSLIVASDPQLWWNFIDGRQGITDEEVEARNQLHIDAMNILISGENLPSETPAPTAVVMNGDLTEYGRWDQWDAYYRLYEGVAAPIFDGMGNHEYENNNAYVSNGCAAQTVDAQSWFEACEADASRTLWGQSACQVYENMVADVFGWCATDAMRRMRHWLDTHEAQLQGRDEGSGAYSWEMGDVHFVQLHNDPLFEVPETTTCSAVNWMKRDLKEAYDRGMKIVLNMHKPISNAMRAHLEGFEYNVVAIFYGHHHDKVGLTDTFAVRGVEIPEFYSGSVEWNLFALARFGPESFTVTSIDTNTGEPVHHAIVRDYINVGAAKVSAPFEGAYPTHSCPLGQVPDGVDGPCHVPDFDIQPVEDCTED